MKAPVLEPTSAGKAAWVIIVLVLAWVAFMFAPVPRHPSAPANEPVRSRPESPLEAVGLRDYVDWQGLPDFFRVWADSAEWHGDRAWFAYWNPGTRSYSYFFEVTREAGTYRFREAGPAEVSRALHLKSAELETLALATDPSPTHPFVFLHATPEKP